MFLGFIQLLFLIGISGSWILVSSTLLNALISLRVLFFQQKLPSFVFSLNDLFFKDHYCYSMLLDHLLNSLIQIMCIILAQVKYFSQGSLIKSEGFNMQAASRRIEVANIYFEEVSCMPSP